MIEITGLTFEYKKEQVLENIDLNLNPGLYFILGKNGSGKSTFLRLMGGILKPKNGIIRIFGHDINTIDTLDRAKLVAYLPQYVDTSHAFKVKDVVAMGLYARTGGFYDSSVYKDKIQEILQLLGIDHLEDRDILNISGGERKKVFIASTLIQDTPVQLFDEPEASLDLKSAIDLLEIFYKKVQKKDKIIIVAIHNILLLSTMLGRCLLVHNRSVKPVDLKDDLAFLNEVIGIDLKLSGSRITISPIN